MRQIGSLLLLLCLIGCSCNCCCCDKVTPSPSPAPVPVDPNQPDGGLVLADSAINDVIASYRTGLKGLFLDVAAKVESGVLKTEIEQNEYINAKSKDIRIESFMILNRDVESSIGGENWNPKTAADYWRKQGESL